MNPRKKLRVLLVTASARIQKSRSRQAAAKMIEALETIADVSVTIRDLVLNPPSHLDSVYVKAVYNHKRNNGNYPEDVARVKESDMLCKELMETDVLIVATAMYNFSVPACLKLWIDHVVRSRKTFHYGQNHKWHGHLKHVTGHIIMSSGSLPPNGHINGQLYDHCALYLQQIFDFIGICDTGVTGFCNTLPIKVQNADYVSVADKIVATHELNLEPIEKKPIDWLNQCLNPVHADQNVTTSNDIAK